MEDKNPTDEEAYHKSHSYGTRGIVLTTLTKPISSMTKVEKDIDVWTRKRFVCQLCPSAFTRRDNLKVHMLKKHDGRSSPFTGKEMQSLFAKDVRSEALSEMDGAEDGEKHDEEICGSLTPPPPTLTKEPPTWKKSFGL